jgi:outer membrane protein OmpA-like peptidoglycan-associated protein
MFFTVVLQKESSMNTRPALSTPRTAALAGLATLALGLLANTGAQTIEPVRAASANPYGINGMSQVISAEPLGAGRLNIQVRGNLFRQDQAMPGAQPAGTDITTGSGGIAIGLNEYFDGFAALHAYNRRGPGVSSSGYGTSVVGAQASIPLSRDIPLRAGAQLVALFGTASGQLNTNELDGYNYLETRTHHDVMVRASQSWLGVKDGKGVKVHLNEGVISSFEPNKSIALVTGVGVEVIPIISLILGLEANSRTYLNEPGAGDPLWVTPSVTWRTPVFINIHAGADVSVSADRSFTTSRALEPYRLFGGLTYSVDTRAGEKAAAREKARRDSLERTALENRARLADSQKDSTAMAAAAAAAQQKALADSMAQKARNDSLALRDAAARLAEERAKRSDMEKQLLTTGLLVMDAVYFETGKTDISINSEPYLTLIAKMLTKYPKLQIEIGGHTDNVGGLKYNQTLSQGRSAAVVAYMLRAAPELAGRVVPRGYAYSQPKATNTTAAGRQLNRRTELKVLNPSVLQEYR